ncbi:preprotein translocase subunit SecY [Lactobacillus selangorensis]|uniref:Preprotein translocase subunit SecY n=1 Tax=Lactobacillus selangorensis TaxID=81857 RepID=A0A0R2FYL5_9LACO|nr:SecY family transport protein [Lactobacillus selangorensis]KRN27689.1 preprotein translocase subunit SecY [Lactobacillus selangorensis]KRN30346.1 preprotein translocase subunit SecY [Lactobacillus selangorensis]
MLIWNFHNKGRNKIDKQVKKGLQVTLIVLLVMQLGQQIPIPMLGRTLTLNLLNSNPIVQVFTVATGAQYTKPTLFSIGMGPYMVTMILGSAVQALGVGKKWSMRFRSYVQRTFTVIVATAQAYEMLLYLTSATKKTLPVSVWVSSIIVLVAGAMYVTWLADFNNVHGIGGLGIMIVPGILSGVIRMFSSTNGFTMNWQFYTLMAVITFVFTKVTVFLNRAELRIPIQQVLVDNDFADSYLPIKVLPGGAMPLMFSMFVFLLPETILGRSTNPTIQHLISTWFTYNTPQGIGVYCLVVIALNYLFSYLSLMPHNMAEDLQKSGNYIFGVLPGAQKEKFLSNRMDGMIFVSSLYAIFISATPLVIGLWFQPATIFSFYFTNVFMLIFVLDTVIIQFKAELKSSHYKLV